MRLIVAFAIAVAARTAAAYPQFQLALEDHCSACHHAPSGGGLLNAYGRDEAGSTISRGGDGRFLHGAWEPPAWLALGADLRGATLAKSVADTTTATAFPMQVDVHARAAFGPFALHVTAGVRGVARAPQPPLVERLASREHYVAYERGDLYARAGRFFPVFGLRLADHTSYVRRFLGANLYEEPYALEVARLTDASEARITGFVPQPSVILGSGYRAAGAAASYEHRIGRTLVGGHARFATSSDETRYLAGAIAKTYLPDAKLLALVELDLQLQTLRAIDTQRLQLAVYAGATQWLARGLLVTGAIQVWEPDFALPRTTRDAFGIDVQYFPRAHVELHLMTRIEAEGHDFDQPGYLALLQAHYYP